MVSAPAGEMTESSAGSVFSFEDEPAFARTEKFIHFTGRSLQSDSPTRTNDPFDQGHTQLRKVRSLNWTNIAGEPVDVNNHLIAKGSSCIMKILAFV